MKKDKTIIVHPSTSEESRALRAFLRLMKLKHNATKNHYSKQVVKKVLQNQEKYLPEK